LKWVIQAFHIYNQGDADFLYFYTDIPYDLTDLNVLVDSNFDLVNGGSSLGWVDKAS